MSPHLGGVGNKWGPPAQVLNPLPKSSLKCSWSNTQVAKPPSLRSSSPLSILLRGFLGAAPAWRDLGATKGSTNLHVPVLLLSITSISSPHWLINPTPCSTGTRSQGPRGCWMPFPGGMRVVRTNPPVCRWPRGCLWPNLWEPGGIRTALVMSLNHRLPPMSAKPNGTRGVLWELALLLRAGWAQIPAIPAGSDG